MKLTNIPHYKIGTMTVFERMSLVTVLLRYKSLTRNFLHGLIGIIQKKRLLKPTTDMLSLTHLLSPRCVASTLLVFLSYWTTGWMNNHVWVGKSKGSNSQLHNIQWISPDSVISILQVASYRNLKWVQRKHFERKEITSVTMTYFQ